MPLLEIWRSASTTTGYSPKRRWKEIARILDMPQIKVFEVATFYTMYNLRRAASITCNSARPRLAG
jgi:NADH:ubiquinone oxidoreductase subunit E